MKKNSWHFFSGLILGILSYSSSESTSRAFKDLEGRHARTLTWAELLKQKKKEQDFILSTTSLLSKEGSLPADRITNLKKDASQVYRPFSVSPSPQVARRQRVEPQRRFRTPYQSDNGSPHSTNTKVPDDKLQRRVLDFVYHKFVEPRIHKNVEPRPSLVEDLISTFESHVKTDLNAWGKSTFEREVSETVSHHSQPPITFKEPPTSESTEISSIAQVEEGSEEDTFIVTDEDGQTQVITVNEIINSLALMDEDEILKLLLEEPDTADTDIERSDQTISRRSDTFEPSARIHTSRPSFTLPQIQPPIPLSRAVENRAKDYENNPNRRIIEESRTPGKIDENDVLLIQDEDGEVRLVTVNDVLTKFSDEKSPVKLPTRVEKLPDPGSFLPQNPAFLTLSSMFKNQQDPTSSLPNIGQQSQTSNPLLQSEEQGKIQQPWPAEIASFHQSIPTPKPDSNMDKIRQTLAQIHSRNKLAPLVSSPTLNGQNAPNSPPVKVLNTANPAYHNTISISPSPSQTQSQKPGIKSTLSNFFSRLLGRKVTNVDISQQPEKDKDEFVQIIMPKPDSPIMEQITIPLPKPIHHKSRYFEQRSSRIEKTRINLPSLSSLNPFKRSTSKEDKISDQDSLHLSSSTTELILQAANVPEDVRKKLVDQMSDQPTFNIPGLEDKLNHEPIERIDRVFTTTNDKKHKKQKHKHHKEPIGYRYIVPPATYVENNRPPPPKPGGYSPTFVEGYHQGLYGPHQPVEVHQLPYYVPPPSVYKKKPKKTKKEKKKDEEIKTKGPPLFDLSFLADVNHISKIGDENESYSFPQVGDAGKFIEVRPKRYR